MLIAQKNSHYNSNNNYKNKRIIFKRTIEFMVSLPKPFHLTVLPFMTEQKV